MMQISHAAYILATVAVTSAAPTFNQFLPHNAAGGITNDSTSVEDRAFDYIICGGGLTGLTVASRLTEDPEISVLVIENGHDNHADPRVYDVRTYGEAFMSELDHNLTSTPVPSQNNQPLLLVAGRTLGGSGSINGASWTKGAASQYDLLPILTGDESWGWEPLNKYMLAAEHLFVPTQEQVEKGAQYDPAYHGYSGGVQVSFAAGMFGGIQLPALKASEVVWTGLQRVADFAAGYVNGATIIPNMVHADQGQNRSSPFTTYAKHQVEQRDNFVILTGHRVIEITWADGDNIVAEGVHFQACPTCEVKSVHTKREVLLAAGSLQSPQLLELSGVGDPSVLEAAGVPLKKAISGVGKNMQEQTKNSIFLTPFSKDFDGSGPPSAISWPNVHQILKSNASATYDWIMADLPTYAAELEVKGLVANGSAALTILEAQVDNVWNDADVSAAEFFFTSTPSTGLVGIDLWNLIVLSRGTVHIQSNNSWDHPIIDPSYFGHPYDLMIQTAAMRQAREVFQTEPLASYIAEENFPGKLVAQGSGDSVWEDFVRRTFTSVWHYIATLSMMKEELGGVVDNRLKVYGIENVRAIDASVLPIQLSAHLSSSLYGIAEKAAEMIKEDQQQKQPYRSSGKDGPRGGHRGPSGGG